MHEVASFWPFDLEFYLFLDRFGRVGTESERCSGRDCSPAPHVKGDGGKSDLGFSFCLSTVVDQA
jgi:hypothetical protein